MDDLSAHPLPRLSTALRREIGARNQLRAMEHEHELTIGDTPSVVYAATGTGSHGNFFPASYRRIVARPLWKARLEKSYTASSRIAYANRRQRYELDCAVSSDALLMNIFCHPGTMRSSRLRALLSVTGEPPEFGVRANIPLISGTLDRTEVDMQLETTNGPLLVEAKLSETDFQYARKDLLQRYCHLDDIFDLSALRRNRGQLRSYQLLRNVLAAEHHAASFAVFLDSRRIDLLEDIFQVYRAVKPVALRSRLHVVTWQEIAACVSRNLQQFLSEKYGIDAAA